MSIKNGDYAGRVVSAGSYVGHIMSDLYGDIFTATVAMEDGTYKNLESSENSWTVDAPAETVEVYKAWKVRMAEEYRVQRAAEEAERARVEAEKEAEKAAKKAAQKAKNLALEAGVVVAKGDVVKVVSGANKGKAGKVFWLGEGSLGTKLGIALDEQKDARGYHSNVAWVLKKNVAKAA